MVRRSVEGVAACLVMIALLPTGCSKDAADDSSPASSTSTSTSTTSSSTTTTVPAGPPAPLTGIPTPDDRLLFLLRPALALKVDNHVDAMPQQGLNSADIVIEERVESISRLMAVYQSADSPVGPIRSARLSDPDLLGLFGIPLFGWSGANDLVSVAVARTPWLVNASWERNKNAYQRRSVHAAPHNLYTDTATLFASAQSTQGTPTPQFPYLGPGQSNAETEPVAGASLSVGATPSEWVWEAASASWLRWQYGRRHTLEEGGQVSAANVVVLETKYKGGSASPIAVSIGSGKAAVLTGGALIEGRWRRDRVSQPFTVVGPDGQPVLLAPGRTWIELPSEGTVEALAAERAAQLVAGK